MLVVLLIMMELLSQANAGNLLERIKTRQSKQVYQMLYYMLKKTEHTMKLMEESKDIPSCILIKRKVKITS